MPTNLGNPPNQEGQDAHPHEVCSELINAFTMLTAHLAPVLPKVAENAPNSWIWKPSLGKYTRNVGEHAINKYEHLMQRGAEKQVDDLIEANKQRRRRSRACCRREQIRKSHEQP